MSWIIESLRTTAGYLQGCPVDFTSGLNCVIGARGTCKSTIVETIRFAFDCDPTRVAMMVEAPTAAAAATVSSRAGLIFETLAGGTARCEISRPSLPGESSILVERNPESTPKVFRDGVHQIEVSDVLRRIEIYSQGDLQTIAEQSTKRLALIDKPNHKRVAELAAQKLVITERLTKLGAAIRQRRPELESRRTKIKGLDAHKKQLAQLEAARPKLSPELEVQRTAYEERRQIYTRMKVAVQTYERALAAATAFTAEAPALREAVIQSSGVTLAPAQSISDAVGRLVDAADAVGKVVARKENLQSHLESLAAEFEKESAQYHTLRKEQQQVNDALRTEDTLRQTVATMESIVDELSKLEAEHTRDVAERAELRSRRDAIADELYSLRLEQIEAINGQFGNHIVLTLQQGVLTEPHRLLLEELLQRSNLRTQAEVARELAERIRPSDLVDIVESGDASRLATTLGRDLGQMTRLVSHLIDAPKLYDLEAVVPEDGLEITMVVRGEARPLGQLSKGQMATALLPLILRDADYPLVIDQPEDDLDNAFVSEKLIERIQQLSKHRQLIFVTHNANIPVLGNANRVIVMEMDGPRRALPARSGDVEEMKDDIIRILEGGKEAFRSRQERYGAALG